MTINSNPQGATVYVDGHQIGKTPVSTDFTYYGTRNIRLEMDNYQTMVVKQKVAPPWYQFPPFDFFSETFSANEIKDRHVWTYDLQQRAISSDDQILERAHAFAFEGSRTVNPDGTLGVPVTRENFEAQQNPYSYPQSYVGTNPDAGFNTPIPMEGGTTEALSAPSEAPITTPSTTPMAPGNVPSSSGWNSVLEPGAPGAATTPVQPNNSTSPTSPTSPTSQNPNAFPTGSADWDSPSRYPQNYQ